MSAPTAQTFGGMTTLPVTAHRTYAEKYRDATFHFSNSVCRATMSTMAVNLGNVPPAMTADALRTSVLQTSDDQMHAFLVLTAARIGDYGTVRCIHRPSLFVPAFGATPGPLHNAAYGFVGDVVDGQYPTNYRWPDNAWNIDGQDIRIPTEQLVNQIMASGAHPNHFGPFDDTSAGTRVARVRRSMYVPPQLLPHVINMEGATPMVAFNLIAAQIQNMSLMQDCSQLLVWLLACATRVSQGAGGTRIQPLAILPP
jgi:hypothetical protein